MPAHGKGLATIQHPWPVHTMIDFCREVLDFLVGKILPCRDRKSTRLNSSHGYISYAVFCLKKKNLQYFLSRLQAVRFSYDVRADDIVLYIRLLLSAHPLRLNIIICESTEQC